MINMRVAGRRLVVCLVVMFFVVAGVLVRPAAGAAVDTPLRQGYAAQVVINEIMWDGVEYVELFNASGSDVRLDGWKLTRQQKDKGEVEVVTFGGEDVIGAGEYWLIERNEEAVSTAADTVVSGLVLVNGGELVRLYDAHRAVADSANRFGSWLAGKNTESGVSMERIAPDSDGGVAEGWVSSSGSIGGRDGTPGAANSSSDPNESELHSNDTNVATAAEGEDAAVSYTGAVVVNEFLPNPAGSDADGEWIELFNTSGSEVDLSGWQLDDGEGGSSPFTIDDGVVISSGGYLIFSRLETGLSLNNNGEQVRLLSPDTVVRSSGGYEGSAKDNQSYNRTDGGGYAVSVRLTPGAKNAIEAPPVKESSTDDEDVAEADEESEDDVEFSDAIFINEFLPDPIGSDPEGEFIELINSGSVPVNLNGWQLDDEEGGSRPHIFSSEVVLAAGGVRAFMRSETGIALNNDGDEVRLFDPDGKVMSSFLYSEKVPEGQSFSRDAKGEYVLGEALTPGKANVFSGEGRVAGSALSALSIGEIRKVKAGIEIVLEGVVIAPPGVLGKGVMYVMDASGGVQIYSSKDELGDVQLGDMVRIFGEVSAVAGEVRVKVVSGEDVVVVKGDGGVEAREVKTGEVGEGIEGVLVAVAGTVTRSSGSTFYIDDGSGEVRVVVKSSTGIEKPTTKKGMRVSVAGVVSETASGYRILPRFQDDLQVGLTAGISDVLPEALEGVEIGVPDLGLAEVSSNPFGDLAEASGEQQMSSLSQSTKEKWNMLIAFGLGAGVAGVGSGALKGEAIWDTKKWRSYIERLRKSIAEVRNRQG